MSVATPLINDDLDPKAGNPRAASVRLKSATASKLAGQINHDLRRGRQPGYVDLDRSLLNRIIMEPARPGQMRRICQERRDLRDTKRAIKSNAAVATVGVITFGAEAARMFEDLKASQQDAAFLELAQAIADRLGTSLHGLVVHCDESTIHAHYQLAAYNRFGDPLSQSTRPGVLSELQDLTAEIMGRHCPGIERGRRYGDRIAAGADFHETLHRSVRELHRELPRDLADKRAQVEAAEAEAAAARERQAKNERLAEAARLKVAAAEADQRKAEKAAKNLAVYERRADEAQKAVVEAEARRSALCADIERLTGEVDTAKAERDEALTAAAAAQADAGRIVEKAQAVSTAVEALAHEMAAGTIRMDTDGRVEAANPGAMRPGLPMLKPAILAGASARAALNAQEAAARAARKEAQEKLACADDAMAMAMHERQQAEALKAEVLTLRDRLAGLLDRVTAWLRRPDLPHDARAQADEIMREAGRDPIRPESGGGGRNRISELRTLGRREEAPPPSGFEHGLDSLDGPG